MKKFFTLIIIILFFITFNVSAAEYNVSSESELVNALVTQDELHTINLNNDINLSNSISITGNVLINGNGHVLSYSDSYSGKLFDVSGSLELSNIKLNGNNKWSWINDSDKFDPNVVGDETTLNIGDKVINNDCFVVTGNLKITNSSIYDTYVDGYDTYSYIKANGDNSNVVIESTTIDNLFGNFIFMTSGYVEINNSNITNSYGLGNKGSLFKINYGELVINNSVFKDNCGFARSGSLIGAVNNSLVTFNSGLIDGNVAKYYSSSSTGSMITLETGSGFIMNGGTISNNIGTLAGVISSRWTNTPDDRGIYLNAGEIKNNSTYKDAWLGSTIFIRSSLYIGKDMVIDGDIVVNNTDASLENNGTVNGKVTLNDASSTAVNNGFIKDLDFLNGKFTNNGIISNAFELDTEIDNNGDITDNYIKELSDVEGKVIVKFDVNEGKEKDNGYTYTSKLYDLNYEFSKEDLLEVEKNGYTFEGWFLDEEFTNEFDTNIILTDNITIYAKWEKIPEIAVPDTSLSVNKIILFVGISLIIFGVIVMYVVINKDKVYE